MLFYNKTKMGLSVPLPSGAALIAPKGTVEITAADEMTAGVQYLKQKGLLVPMSTVALTPVPAPVAAPTPVKKQEISAPVVAAPLPPPPPVEEPPAPPLVVEEEPATPPPVAEVETPTAVESVPAETTPPTEPPPETPSWVGRRRRRG